MADEADDTLEIEQPDPEIDEEQGGEAEVTLEGEEPSEQGDDPNESAVIRDFRKREREKDKRIRELEAKTAQPAPQLPADPGARPALADFDYDDEKHSEALDAWIEAKTARAAAERDTQQQALEIEQRRREGYQAAKAAQPIAGIDAAEERVFAQVDDMTRNALLHAKSAAVIAALDKYPDRMAAVNAAVAAGDVVEALMMIGELRGKAKIVAKGRKAPNPEEIPVGTASVRQESGDKKEANLLAAAQKDPAKMQAYRDYMSAKRKAAR